MFIVVAIRMNKQSHKFFYMILTEAICMGKDAPHA